MGPSVPGRRDGAGAAPTGRYARGVEALARDLWGPGTCQKRRACLADRIDLFRRSAAYVDRILRGEKPGDLPVQQPTKYEFLVNLKTAKSLGLDLPDRLLALANEVIE